MAYSDAMINNCDLLINSLNISRVIQSVAGFPTEQKYLDYLNAFSNTIQAV